MFSAVVVQGHLDTYLVDRRPGEIRRLRDGVLLESEALARMFQLSGSPDSPRGLLPLPQALIMDNFSGVF